MTRTTTSRADTTASGPASTTNTKQEPTMEQNETYAIELELPRFHPAEAGFLARAFFRVGFAIYRAYDEEILSLDRRDSPGDDIPF
jgi:hypothetical protein